MEYFKNLDKKSKQELKLGVLSLLFITFVIYILPSGFLNKYQISLKERGGEDLSAQDAKFDPYNSGLSLVVKTMGDESGSRPAWQSIILNSDPLISASDANLFASDTVAIDPKTSNVTDLVARDLYVADKAMKSSGASAADKTAIASALSVSVGNFAKAKVYTMGDINISGDNSASAMMKYSNTMSAAGETTKNIIPLTQFAALQNYTTTKDIKYLNALTPDIAHLQASLDTALSVPVPSDIAKAHLDMVNLISVKLTSFTNIKLSVSDPARGLIALSSAKNDMALESTVMINYIKALAAKGAGFKATYSAK